MYQKTIIQILMIAIVLILSCSIESSDKWRKFENKTTKYQAPTRWFVMDPFKKTDIYWSFLWFRYFPPNNCRMALFKSNPADQNQFFVVIGPKEILWKPIEENLQKYNNDPNIISIRKYQMRTEDGIFVTVYTASRKATGFDKEDITLMLGHAEFEDKVFMINGGGRSVRFDIELIENFMNSLVLKGD